MARTITRAGARLDVGQQRSHNEDNLRCRQATTDEEAHNFGDLFVLADGMGGHAAGEVASRLAVDTILSVFYSLKPADIGKNLLEAILQANQAIYEPASDDPNLYGMGTTCVCIAIHGDRMYVAHVGDSRAYLLRDGSFEQITQDHSWVEEQVRYGLLTPEEARSHPMRNVITRALGNAPEVSVDLSIREAIAGDIVLLCSDGLSGVVEDETIKSILTSEMELQSAVDALVDLANEAGGPDNISIIALRIEQVVPVDNVLLSDEDPSEERPKKGWSRFLPFS